MKDTPSLPTLIRSALALSLLSTPLTLAAQTPSVQLPLYSSSNSYGLLDSFRTTADPSAALPPTAPLPAPPTLSNARRTDISFGLFGDFITTRTFTYPGSPYTDVDTQSATPSRGGLVTFHQQFRSWLGYRVAGSYARTTLNYDYRVNGPNGTVANYGQDSIRAGVYGFSLSYAVQGPHTRRISTFAEAGVGMLAFAPTNTSETTGSRFLPSEVFALGVDDHLTPRWSLRAEFRGTSFNSPGFSYSASNPAAVFIPHGRTFASQPTLSLDYRFGNLPAAPTPQHSPIHPVKTSISLGGFADLTAARFQTVNNGSLTTQSLTPSGGTLGTFRQQFAPWLGYSVNMGYTRNSLHDTEGATAGSANTYNNLYIANNVYELSLAYVAEKHITPRLSGFFDIGAGMLAFLPETGRANSANTFILATKAPVSFRPLGVGGLGIDYKLSPAFAFRAEYRGQIFKFPDYGIGLPRMTTLSSQPTFSLVYTFRPQKN